MTGQFALGQTVSNAERTYRFIGNIIQDAITNPYLTLFDTVSPGTVDIDGRWTIEHSDTTSIREYGGRGSVIEASTPGATRIQGYLASYYTSQTRFPLHDGIWGNNAIEKFTAEGIQNQIAAIRFETQYLFHRLTGHMYDAGADLTRGTRLEYSDQIKLKNNTITATVPIDYDPLSKYDTDDKKRGLTYEKLVRAGTLIRRVNPGIDTNDFWVLGGTSAAQSMLLDEQLRGATFTDVNRNLFSEILDSNNRFSGTEILNLDRGNFNMMLSSHIGDENATFNVNFTEGVDRETIKDSTTVGYDANSNNDITVPLADGTTTTAIENISWVYMVVPRYIEIARFTGTPASYLGEDGRRWGQEYRATLSSMGIGRYLNSAIVRIPYVSL